MKRVVFILITLLFAAGTTDVQAQWLKKLGQKAIDRAEDRAKKKVEKKVDDAVDKTVDNAFEGAEDAVKGEKKEEKKEDKKGKADDNTDADEQNDGQQQQKGQSLEMTYAKSDFVAGDEVFFEDNQANEQLGEFPSQWDMDYGNAEIVDFGGEKCIMLIGYTVLSPLIGDGKKYLPEQFTLEFDIYPRYTYDNKKASSAFEIGLGDGRALVSRFHCGGRGGAFLSTSWKKPNGDGGSLNSGDNKIYFSYNEWHHVAISFNKRALKLYVDGVRIVNIPNMKQPASLWIWSNDNEALYKNFRIAKGAVPLYDRMISDGKFITYGITFDVGKSVIKPESMGEINRIVQLMSENPDLKFSVEGHTDSTGNVTSNQTLSEARSKAIVDKLVELGISADRLVSAGKGQDSPIADNGTDEGRAKNRRVEFVKQ